MPALMRARLLGLLLAALAPLPALGQEATEALQPGDVLEFATDALSYDEGTETVVATGNVVISRDGYRLRADRVTYERATGEVVAQGNVIVVDPEGNQAFGERVEVSETLRDATIDNILVVLEEGGRLAAQSGTRVDGVTTLSRAVYSPCNIGEGCERNTPIWQIKAVRVVHDPERDRISYRDAYLELLGIPVLYLPRFSHPTGGSGNAPGLLVPDVKFDNALGFTVAAPYYWPLDANNDLTLTPYLFTDANPMLGAEYRRLFDSGPIQVGGLITYAERVNFDQETAQTSRSDNDIRGYFYSNGQFQHDPRWRSTYGLRLTTDDTFLRRYDVSQDDVLRNFYQLERFGGTSYLSIEGWAFQGLRLDDSEGQIPVALPLVEYRWRPERNVIGGTIDLLANTLAITRGDGQDMQRGIVQARWERVETTTLGHRVTLTALGRGDVYNVLDPDQVIFPEYSGSSGVHARAIPLAAIDVEWPFAGPAFGGIQTITPHVQFVATPFVDNDDIPNEDARAVDLEEVNLFSLNRFPGYDRWEGGARVTYGLTYTLDRPNWRVRAEVGQTYRFDDSPDLFPQGTGLSGKFSDIVGRTTLRFGRLVNVVHRYRIDQSDLELRRNEIDALVGSARTYAQVAYVRLDRDIGIEDLRDREEVRAGGRMQVARFWSVFGSAIADLTSREEDPLSNRDGFQPIRHRLGIAYDDDCFAFALTWRRDYITDRDDRAGSSFLVRFALKNLGF